MQIDFTLSGWRGEMEENFPRKKGAFNMEVGEEGCNGRGKHEQPLGIFKLQQKASEWSRMARQSVECEISEVEQPGKDFWVLF
jgi:hypothetical protein